MILPRFFLFVASSLICQVVSQLDVEARRMELWREPHFDTEARRMGIWREPHHHMMARRVEINSVKVEKSDDDVTEVSSTAVDVPMEGVDDFNKRYCTIKGCKPATNVHLDAMLEMPQARRDFILRNEIIDPLYNLSMEMKPVSFNRAVPYLGVLLDAGQHYYPMEWIHNLLQLMHALGYNLLHLRLTDDQAFNMELTSMPELAKPALDSDGRVYSASELKELVTYAASLNITIMPEVNVQGHAGGWAGNHTPGLIVPCPGYICQQGRDLRLNQTHPKVKHIIRTVLVEVLDIFYTSPFLHLGGDNEPHTSNRCLLEAHVNAAVNYQEIDAFLKQLIAVELKRVGILRWKEIISDFSSPVRDPDEEVSDREPMDGPSFVDSAARFLRTGIASHCWDTKDFQESTNATLAVRSQGLYFDASDDVEGFSLYESIREITGSQESGPLALVVGAFELGAHQWLDANVIGRLITVAMGSAGLDCEQANFDTMYYGVCHDQLRLDPKLCERHGLPNFSRWLFQVELEQMRKDSRNELCNRLTTTESKRVISSTRHWEKQVAMEIAMDNFWVRFADDAPKFSSSTLPVPPINATFTVFDMLQHHEESQL